LHSSWMMTYASQVRGRVLAALAQATAAGVLQVLAIMAQNLCPAMFKYLSPGFKTQRRPHPPTAAAAAAAAASAPSSRLAAGLENQRKVQAKAGLGDQPRILGKKRKRTDGAAAAGAVAVAAPLAAPHATTQSELRAIACFNRFQAVKLGEEEAGGAANGSATWVQAWAVPPALPVSSREDEEDEDEDEQGEAGAGIFALAGQAMRAGPHQAHPGQTSVTSESQMLAPYVLGGQVQSSNLLR